MNEVRKKENKERKKEKDKQASKKKWVPRHPLEEHKFQAWM